jgi:branched-chain amino acid transport system substrate-binding protein
MVRRRAIKERAQTMKSWNCGVAVNYPLRQGIKVEPTNYIEQRGGKVLGSSKHPLNRSDFASLLQAQNSKAKMIGLGHAGGDAVNAVKQAAEFGIQEGGQNALLLFINDMHGMGLKVAQGLLLAESFCWAWMMTPAPSPSTSPQGRP